MTTTSLYTHGSWKGTLQPIPLSEAISQNIALPSRIPKNAFVLSISPNSPLENEIHISGITPPLHIIVGKNSQARIVESTDNSFHLSLDLQENSSLHHFRSEQTSSETLSSFFASLKQNARLTCVAVTAAKNSQIGSHILLTGEDAEVSIHSLSLSSTTCIQQQTFLIEHIAPHTKSFQLYKGVVEGFASATHSVLIHKKAIKSQSHQTSRFLTLKDSAVTHNKPILQIFSDDVIATHGATSGQIEREFLLYMNARGIDKKTAQNMLVWGFCKEIIMLMPSQQSSYFKKIVHGLV